MVELVPNVHKQRVPYENKSSVFIVYRRFIAPMRMFRRTFYVGK